MPEGAQLHQLQYEQYVAGCGKCAFIFSEKLRSTHRRIEVYPPQSWSSGYYIYLVDVRCGRGPLASGGVLEAYRNIPESLMAQAIIYHLLETGAEK